MRVCASASVAAVMGVMWWRPALGEAESNAPRGGGNRLAGF